MSIRSPYKVSRIGPLVNYPAVQAGTRKTTMLLADGLEGWFISLRAKSASPHTLHRYGYVWTRFGAFLAERGVTTIEQLKAEHARLFILQRLGQVALVTAHFEVIPLKSFTSWLTQQEFLPVDPFVRVKKPKLDREDMDVLRPDEVKRLLASFDRTRPDELRDWVIVRLILATGLRRGEVIGARLDGFDPAAGSLRIMGKGRKERRVPLPDDLSAQIWTYTKKVRAKYARSEYLFVSRLGTALGGDYLSAEFKGYVKRAGIERRTTLHKLRHWSATAMIAAGMQMELVSRCLGHADSAITSRIYSHVRFSDVQQAHKSANPLRLIG